MKPYRILSVELTDLNTFKPFPGAGEFEKAFAANKSGTSYFKFFTEAECKAAEKKLKQLDLEYRLYYGIELSDDDDVYNYPAIAASPYVEYDLINVKGKKLELNFKKIGSKNYLRDFATEKFIFSEKAKKVFDKFCPQLEYKMYVNEKNGKKYFIPQNVNELAEPMIFVHADKIVESEGEQYKGTFYPAYSDGRIKLTGKSLEQLSKENFCICSSFQYKDKVYRQASSNVFATGKLSLELKKHFSKETSEENFTYAYTLGNI